MKKKVVLFALTVLIAAGLQAGPEPRSGDTGGLTRLQTDWLAAANAKDSTRLAALYAENAMLMPPNAAMAKGRPAIQAVWQGMMDENARDITLTAIDRSVCGDLGYEAGTYTLNMGAPGGPVASDKGKYLMTVRRGPGGKWLIQNDIFNSDLSCPGGGK
jgi:uncharacterized protein (TIGR02246 family)